MGTKITLNRINIKENKNNEVTSEKIFQPYKVRDKNGEFLFHEDGIFSDKIFGRFGKCKCGHRTKPGFCSYCNCRVLSKKKLPDFYIPFDFVDIPYLNLTIDHKKAKEIENLFYYKGFIYNKEYYDFNLLELDVSKLEMDKVLIGKDAILSYKGITEEWYNKQVYNKLPISHTYIRKIVDLGDHHYLGTLNTIYINILKQRTKLLKYLDLGVQDKFFELACKKNIIEEINKAYDEMFNMLTLTKKSVVAKELRGQGITGNIRAVVTNNFGLDEDTVLIGKYFIKTLYPKFYEQYTQNGITDIDAINKRLAREGYFVLLNRQPTLGSKSILAMRPKFSEEDNYKYIMQVNPIIMSGLAGDFDGDVLSIIALYSKAACKEVRALLPSRNYLEEANGTIRNAIPEDMIYTMKNIYENNEELAEKIHEIIQ